MKMFLFSLLVVSAIAYADEKPAQDDPPREQIILQCGSLKGIGRLIVIDEEGAVHEMVVTCGTSV